ncbi:MAG: SMC-Scp complex subunit ScpB [bacterium]|nr:SMC-Scp complex subunit ScpB [bacterium]
MLLVIVINKKMEDNNNLVGQLEALLFIYGEPMTFRKMAQILKIEESEVGPLVESLADKLNKNIGGLGLVIEGERAQLTTRGEFTNIAEQIIKEAVNETLTPAALETAAIITYTGPISRAELDYIRGVNSTFILRNLLIRGLIERGRDPKRSNAFIYNPSFEFLRHLGINKREDLPEYDKFQELIKTLRQPEPEGPPVSDVEAASPVNEDEQAPN